jgi:hypothetical protein
MVKSPGFQSIFLQFAGQSAKYRASKSSVKPADACYDLEKIMDEITIRLHIEPLDEGGFVATSPDVPSRQGYG